MFSNLLPLLIIFLLGILLKKLKVFSTRDASKFLLFVFYISAPALILYTFPSFHFEKSDFILPLLGALISVFMFIASFSLFKLGHAKIERKTKGTVYTASMIANTSLVIAIMLSLFGKSGMVKAQMLDFGNGLLIFSLVYYMSALYGTGKPKSALKKLLTSPPIWALAISLTMNYLSLSFPQWINSSLKILSQTLVPLVIFSLGVYINLNLKKNLKPALVVVSIRILFGLILGMAIVFLLHLTGLNKLVVLLAFSAPCGFNTLIFSSVNKLDEELASSVVSLSILLYIIIVPLLLHSIHV